MKRSGLVILVVLVSLVLAACSTATTPAPAGTSSAAVDTPAPQAGKTTVIGRVVSTKTGQPMNQTTVRLAEVYKNENQEGAYVLDGATSPGGITNAEGSFTIANIDPHEYVIVVGDIYGAHTVVADETAKKPRIWNAEVDKVLDIGELRVDL